MTNDDDNDKIDGGMVLRVVAPLLLATVMALRVVAPLLLATVMASPLTLTSTPGGGAGAAASGHRRTGGRWTRGGRGRGERHTLPATAG
jgi:hypothetical protein